MRYLIITVFLLTNLSAMRQINCSDHFIKNNQSGRPNLDFSMESPSGHFLIHYNNYYTNIEDYAAQVGLAADLSREFIIETLGFREEIPDDDGIYDIYIMQLNNGEYGFNTPIENEDGIYPYDGSSWIKIDDDFIGSYYITTGLDAMRITVAHEFFHATQRAYAPIPGSNSFFWELSSIWVEDLIYPSINDYIEFSQVGDDYFQDPEKNMDQRVSMIPIGRMATPIEIANVVYWLGSDENTFTTGQVITAAGGE